MNDNINHDIYKNIMSNNPIIDEEYLSHILKLSPNKVIDNIIITEIVESNTALVIRMDVNINDGDTMYVKRLFIKTIKANQSENLYNDKSM